MGSRQGSGARSVVYGNRQFVKALVGDGSGNVKGDRLGIWKFTETILGGDFPS